MQEGEGKGITVEKTVTVERPVSEVYAFWHNFENLPRFMDHLESVTVQEGGRSHWVAKAPLGQKVEWDAEIINDLRDQMIAWRSVGETPTPNAGYVRFEQEPEGRGTVVRVSLEYAPPGGPVGALVAKVFGEEPNQQVDEDLRRFKSIMEAGETPTTEGQPSGRAPVGDEYLKGQQKSLDKIGADAAGDTVTEASEESFPGSDPPSWSGTPQQGV